MSRVLLLAADQDVQEGLKESLRVKDIECEIVPSGKRGLARLSHNSLDAVVVDSSIADGPPQDWVRRARGQDCLLPIIVTSSKDELVELLVCLEVGADDYVVQPFDPEKFAAKIEARIRRAAEYSIPKDPYPGFNFGDIRIDQEKHEVYVRGERVYFTRKEFELLLALAENEGRIMRHPDLLTKVWGYAEDSQSRTLTVHINRVRSKIERDPGCPEMIVTIDCVGYKFVAPRRDE